MWFCIKFGPQSGQFGIWMGHFFLKKLVFVWDYLQNLQQHVPTKIKFEYPRWSSFWQTFSNEKYTFDICHQWDAYNCVCNIYVFLRHLCLLHTKLGSNLTKFWKNLVILHTIWVTIGPIGIWMGHFFLKNWYLYGSTYKICGSTSLPKPNLSTPHGSSSFWHTFSNEKCTFDICHQWDAYNCLCNIYVILHHLCLLNTNVLYKNILFSNCTLWNYQLRWLHCKCILISSFLFFFFCFF